MSKQHDEELKILEESLYKGDISLKEYNRQIREMERDEHAGIGSSSLLGLNRL